jgi:endoglucanase
MNYKALLLFVFLYIYSAPNYCQERAFLNKVIYDDFGAIVRGDTTQKKITLVFTGDEYADGGTHILKVLKKHKISGAFFFTGRFYSNAEFKPIIRNMKKFRHYLGAHSDQHLLYCDWVKRDSLLIDKIVFAEDLRANYEKMSAHGIKTKDAPYFLPPFEWYNKTISEWTRQEGFTLINFTHGTRSAADYTYPEMESRYLSSDYIFQSIIDYEKKSANGMNGFFLLIHIGTDPRRTDKFYFRLDDLLSYLKNKGYEFISLNEMIN